MAVCATVGMRLPITASSTAATVTDCGVRQSVVVKVSDGGVTVTAPESRRVGSGATLTVTAPVGALSSATVHVARVSASVPLSLMNAAVPDRVIRGRSVLVTATATSAAGTAP